MTDALVSVKFLTASQQANAWQQHNIFDSWLLTDSQDIRGTVHELSYSHTPRFAKLVRHHLLALSPPLLRAQGCTSDMGGCTANNGWC